MKDFKLKNSIYKFKNNTFFHTAKKDKKDLISVEIGDSKQPDFKPQFKLMRWQNEVNLSIRAEEHLNSTTEVEGNKIKYITPEYEIHQYNKPDVSEDGGFEFEWILNKKPKLNILKASIKTKGLKFLYQGKLSNEQIEKGFYRSENIIGSYAVYASENKINYEGGKEYKCGKVAHIYRPKAIDNKGKEVWCDLNIDEEKEILTVTVPEKFLKDASYPVIVDPTFGYEFAGGTAATCSNTFHPFCNFYGANVALTGDSIKRFSVFSRKVTNTANIELAAYSISGGVPVSRLAAAVTVSVNSTTPQWWHSGAVNQVMAAGVNYNASCGGWSGSPGNNAVYFDDNGDGQSSYHNATGSLPATWAQQTTFTSIVSVYATFLHPPIDINYVYFINIDKGKL